MGCYGVTYDVGVSDDLVYRIHLPPIFPYMSEILVTTEYEIEQDWNTQVPVPSHLV